MLFRLACRFLIMIVVLAGVRIGACSKTAHHGTAAPLASTAQASDDDAGAGDSDVIRRQKILDRERGSYGDGYGNRDARADARDSRDAASDELMRALVQASREHANQPRYRPGEPMSTAQPTR